MPTPDRIYSIGTVSVNRGDTSIVGSGGMLWASEARAYDRISVVGYGECTVMDVTDDTHLVIDAWPYANVPAGASYKLIKTSLDRASAASQIAAVTDLVDELDADGFIWFVGPDETAPRWNKGKEGQAALQPDTGKKWVRRSGVWVFVGIERGVSPKGAWSSATAYTVNDVVSRNGSAYMALADNTNSAPPSANWMVLGAGGTATVAIGTVTSLSAGSAPTVANSGTATAAILNFGIPDSRGYAATSTTSITIGTGSKTFTIAGGTGGTAYQVGAFMRAAPSTFPDYYVAGAIAEITSTTIKINVTEYNGAGTFSAWNLNISGRIGRDAPGIADLMAFGRYRDRLDDWRAIGVSDRPTTFLRFS